VTYALPPAVTQALRGKTVLVTGSAGFLGTHICRAIHMAEGSPIGLDIKNGADVSRDDWPKPHRRIDMLIHAAGTASPFHYRKKPLLALDAAVAGTRNMIAAAEESGAKLLFLSSSEIYGDPLVVPTPETYRSHVETMGDRSSYDVSKCLGETLIHLAAERGVHANAVRIFNSYGPGMSDDDRRFMPNLRRAKRLNESIRIYGTGKQTRTFCFVTDTIRGCLSALVLGAPGRVWNIGNDKPEVTMPEVAEMAGVTVERVSYPPEWPGEGEPQRRCPEISRAREELGYEPVVSLDAGLVEFLA